MGLQWAVQVFGERTDDISATPCVLLQVSETPGAASSGEATHRVFGNVE